MKTLESLKEKFREEFGAEPERLFFAPSRINIIGEHIDYNGGEVFPTAIGLGTYALVKEAPDFSLVSLNMPEKITVALEDTEYAEEKAWANYPLGMIKMIKEAGYPIAGFHGLFYGNIPSGAGLSSSASLEVLTAAVERGLTGRGPDPLETALLGQKTENVHFGLKTGIMDQFAIAMGKKDHGILLNTATLTHRYIPLDLRDCTLVIMNTGLRRELVSGSYNERREDCERALSLLKDHFPIESLCDLPPEDLSEALDFLSEDVLKKRVRHVVTENDRVKRAIRALEEGRMEETGELLNASHLSLKEDYEVTGPELDTITQLAREHPGCLGARMTGAGFSGCAIALVRNGSTEDFIDKVKARYDKKTGHTSEFYLSKAADGPGERSLKGELL